MRLPNWMGDRLRAGEPSRYVTSHPDHPDQIEAIHKRALIIFTGICSMTCASTLFLAGLTSLTELRE